jgi:hypothetical protein
MAEEKDNNVWPSGYSEAKTIDEFDYLMTGKNGAPLTKFNKDKYKQYLSTTGQRMKAVSSGVLPAGPADKEMYMVLESSGTWTFGGNTFVNVEYQILTLWWNKNTWSVENIHLLARGKDGRDIMDWEAKPYAFSSSVPKVSFIVFKDGIIWENNAATVADDVPGINPKWIKKAGGVGEDKTPIIISILNSGVANSNGAFTNDANVFRSDYFLLKEGEMIKARLKGLAINRNAISVYDLNKLYIISESIPYSDAVSYHDYNYKAPYDCYVIVSNHRPSGVPLEESANIVKKYLSNVDIDNSTSVHGVPSINSFSTFKNNKGTKTFPLNTFSLVGVYSSTGLLNAMENLGKYTPFIFLKEGESIEIDTLIQSVAGVVFKTDKTTFITFISSAAIKGQTLFRKGVYKATEDCYVIAQTIERNIEGTIHKYGNYTIEYPYFLIPNDINNTISKNPLPSYDNVKMLLDNGGVRKYSIEAFTGRGYNQGAIPSPSTSWAYTQKYPLVKGQVLTAYVAAEAAPNPPANNSSNILLIVYATDGVTIKERIRGTVIGFNTISFVATESCLIHVNHFNAPKYQNAEWVEITQPKIYATLADIGTGISGSKGGVAVPNVTVNDPKDVIEIEFTTTDPIPVDKTTVMKGLGKINIDSIVWDLYMEFEAQGSSSLVFPEKNWTIKLFTDEAQTISKKLRIAGLLPHDEYVLKVNWIDSTHTNNIVANRLWEQMIRTRKGFPQRETEWAIIGKVGANSATNGGTGHVNGFPAKLKINGEFYGIGTFNIGKKYQNYDLVNNSETNIQIELGNAVDFYTGGGTVEKRVPKVPTATTAANIKKLWDVCALPLDTFGTSARNMFWTTNIVDMYLFLDYLRLVDCVSRNSHIMSFTSGDKWLFTPYDLDSWIKSITGAEVAPTTGRIWDVALNVPANTREFWGVKVWDEYQVEIKSRYKELRDIGVFDSNNVTNLARELQSTFTRNLYEEDLARWPQKNWSIKSLELMQSWVAARTLYLDSVYGYTAS